MNLTARITGILSAVILFLLAINLIYQTRSDIESIHNMENRHRNCFTRMITLMSIPYVKNHDKDMVHRLIEKVIKLRMDVRYVEIKSINGFYYEYEINMLKSNEEVTMSIDKIDVNIVFNDKNIEPLIRDKILEQAVNSIIIYIILLLFVHITVKKTVYVKLHKLIQIADKAVKDTGVSAVRENDELSYLVNTVSGMVGKILLLNNELSIAIQECQLSEKLAKANNKLTTEISERKNAETQLKIAYEDIIRSKEQLSRSEKLASLGQLVAGISHEINTPVGIAVTLTSNIQIEINKISRAVEHNKLTRDCLISFVGDTSESLELMSKVLTDTSNLIKTFKVVAADRFTQERRVFNVNNYVENVILSLKPKLKKYKHTINVYCDPSLKIDSLPGAFGQILTNFIVNSLNHGFKKDEKGEIDIAICIKNSVLNLIYKDNGKGVTDSSIGKIFDPFYTSNRALGGTGLGLNIVYNLVIDVLSGSISCENDSGLKFTITVPLDV